MAYKHSPSPNFIDVFAGCGGLSLGLMRAGWQGLFAVEKDAFAFDTLRANLCQSDIERMAKRPSFAWPQWLPQKAHCISSLLEEYANQLNLLKDKVDLLAGGPPCQGFSSAGRRDSNDPRNALMDDYLRLVQQIQPKMVLIENVHGITVDFTNEEATESVNYAKKLIKALQENYDVEWRMINVADFGVPQARKRFFLIGTKKGWKSSGKTPLTHLFENRLTFLKERSIYAPAKSSAAISDLEISRNGTTLCPDSKGFLAIAYKSPRTNYQKLMRKGARGCPSSTRLANHRPDIIERFKQIIDLSHEQGRLNVSINQEMRQSFGLKKMALRVLDPNRPSPTITSMPDDLLHYAEPRILSVRETARLQSFPDWFEFRGKYTTGGHLRKMEVPRYTQVANAVPPLVAEAVGLSLMTWQRHAVKKEGDATGGISIIRKSNKATQIA